MKALACPALRRNVELPFPRACRNVMVPAEARRCQTSVPTQTSSCGSTAEMKLAAAVAREHTPNRVLLSKTSASPVKQIHCVGLADQLLSNPAGNSRRAAELLYCSPKRRARHQLGELTEGRLAVSASFREVC